VTEPLWKYMGGKRKLAPTILEALGPCDRYVEPFVGAGAVALARGGRVYLDPPYVGVQAYSGGARWERRDLVELLDAARAAVARGAVVAFSHHADVLDLVPGWRVVEVEAARPVNRDGAGRGKVREIVAVLGPTSAPGDVGGSESARDA